MRGFVLFFVLGCASAPTASGPTTPEPVGATETVLPEGPLPVQCEAPLQLGAISREAIDGFSVASNSGTIEITRTDGVWSIVAPLAARVDANAVRTLLDKVSQMDIAGVITTESALHSRLEVDESGLRVAIRQGGADPNCRGRIRVS